MNTLELKHIAPYLPYGLHIYCTKREEISRREWVDKTYINTLIPNQLNYLNEIKPILRPLSDLTKEITINGETFVPLIEIINFLKIVNTKYIVLENSVDLFLKTTKEDKRVRFWFSNFKGIFFNCSDMSVLRYKDHYGAVNKLLEWHFDIFGLIEKGLAIDFNTIKE